MQQSLLQIFCWSMNKKLNDKYKLYIGDDGDQHQAEDVSQ